MTGMGITTFRRWRPVLLLCTCLTPGCSLWFDSEPEIETREIAFEVAPDLNEDYPLAFDLVFVEDPGRHRRR